MKMTRLGSITAIILIGMIFCMAGIKAFPYQLNLTDGTLIDLNQSENSTNITIYIVHIWTNISTNISYNNYTCINCTYTNLSAVNVTQSNVTYIDFKSYNKSEIDDKFSSIDSSLRSLVSGNAAKSDTDALGNRIAALENKKTPVSNTFWLWMAIIVLALFNAYVAYVIYRGGRE